MAVADIVVSKPGGLTTSEMLARGAVMVIVNPIPGQESRNSDFLLENGAAIKINNSARWASSSISCSATSIAWPRLSPTPVDWPVPARPMMSRSWP